MSERVTFGRARRLSMPWRAMVVGLAALLAFIPTPPGFVERFYSTWAYAGFSLS